MCMSKTSHLDDLTLDEIRDIDEFYESKDRKKSSIEEFLEELNGPAQMSS